MSKDIVVEPQDFATYLEVAKNSVGARTWRRGIAKVDGKPTDILKEGELSCAFFVSSVLKMFDAIKQIHANMDSTVKDLLESGWQKVDSPQMGDLVRYTPRQTGVSHEHLGIYIGEGQVVTNNFTRSQPERGGVPEIVDWQYKGHPDGERGIIAIYRGKHLFRS